MIQDLFIEWKPTILINNPHMYMLSFFLPTERLWTFECVPDPHRPIYSQLTYKEHMKNEYELWLIVEETYSVLKQLFHLMPKAIKDLPAGLRNHPEIKELQEYDIFTDFSLFEKAYPIKSEEECEKAHPLKDEEEE